MPRWSRLLHGRWWPSHRRGLPWQRLAPVTTPHRASCAVLWVVFAAWLAAWLVAHQGYLLDPQLQNNDARFGLFAFHLYSTEPTLQDDPIAADSIIRLTPGIWAIYRTLTPIVGLHWASKIVQGLCLGILAAAAVILARSRRGGLAAALLLVFVLLHTPVVVNKIGGGHGRAFTFPLVALWYAGIVAASARVRFTAVGAAALLYPPAILLLLGAEGLYALRGLRHLSLERLAARLRPYLLLVGVCMLLVAPQKLFRDAHGSVATMAQARAEPAFLHSPRGILPFEPPLEEGARYMAHPYRAHGQSPVAGLPEAWNGLGAVGPWLVLAALAVPIVCRRAPLPTAAVAIGVAAVVTYAAARAFAFKLYAPDRYLHYGVTAASMLFAAGTIGGLWPAFRPRVTRAVRRNVAAAAVIAGVWLIAGDGFLGPRTPARDGTVNHHGNDIDRRAQGDLYDFIATLPATARLAVHPADGAGVTYWTGRATTDHHESLQPWWPDSWARAAARTQATYRALYATSVDDLLSYCSAHDVTHLLIHAGRYGPEFRTHARLWPPFDAYVDELLAAVDQHELVVPTLPGESIVFARSPWIIYGVSRITPPPILAAP